MSPVSDAAEDTVLPVSGSAEETVLSVRTEEAVLSAFGMNCHVPVNVTSPSATVAEVKSYDSKIQLPSSVSTDVFSGACAVTSVPLVY